MDPEHDIEQKPAWYSMTFLDILIRKFQVGSLNLEFTGFIGLCVKIVKVTHHPPTRFSLWLFYLPQPKSRKRTETNWKKLEIIWKQTIKVKMASKKDSFMKCWKIVWEFMVPTDKNFQTGLLVLDVACYVIL